ncbi:carbon-nitrogen hydrolase family protein [Paractinoplanes atraurantiacus]|uniref:Predicted amidohydrolase n=1 Tax=Paractinoplanes atraurantiacus TaxID=1036182 RepID=A0A285JDA9_9ACTN|nr:carbon-nitrogen hydrolase family protein [Actinoplanes atraurantiacus]SNY57807.1 Predicted amidohydrolase [Actinoplanes atraurantiacus]
MRIAACQTPEILGDVEAALACAERFAADAAGADLLLFPEGFLQGYLVTDEHVRRHALALDSAAFADILQRLTPVRPVLVLGMLERNGERFHNTAAVIHCGRLLGAYRKTQLVPGEAVFTPGDDYPVFDLAGVRFGINICYDTRFPFAAAAVAAQGARVLLVLSQNMMPRGKAEHWKDLHNAIRADRARETGMWVVSADVTGERDAGRVGWGPTGVINPDGELVAQVPLMTTGFVVAHL